MEGRAPDLQPGVAPSLDGQIALLEEFSLAANLAVMGAAAVLNGERHGLFFYQDLPELGIGRGFHGLGAFEPGPICFTNGVSPLAIRCAWVAGMDRVLVVYPGFPRVLPEMSVDDLCEASAEELVEAVESGAGALVGQAEIVAQTSRLAAEAREALGTAFLDVDQFREPGLPGLSLEVVVLPLRRHPLTNESGYKGPSFGA